MSINISVPGRQKLATLEKSTRQNPEADENNDLSGFARGFG
jgi:hypothetical protein